MTDINKQIEEESEMIAREGVENILSEKNYIDKMKLHSAIKMTYKIGYKSALHSSRWRKVSEELPEVKDENYFINIKRYDNEFRIDTICVFAEMEDVKGYLEFNNVDSWKPID